MASYKNDIQRGVLPDMADNATRDKLIRAVERQRFDVVDELETLCRKYSKLSGKRKLRKRRFKVGEGPNDWTRINR